MPDVTMQAIVLRAANYRDYDRILTLFAFGEGRVTAAARACRRMKSPLLNSTTPFVSGEFVLNERQGRYTVRSCAVMQAHYPLRSNPLRLAYAAYVCALCEEVVQPSQPADVLYRLLLEALAHLSFGDAPPANVALPFLMRLLDEQGIGPVLAQCSRCGRPTPNPRFPPHGFGALCADCAPGEHPIPAQTLLLCEQARHGPFAPSEGNARAAFTLLAEYAAAHLDKDFRALRMIERLEG